MILIKSSAIIAFNLHIQPHFSPELKSNSISGLFRMTTDYQLLRFMHVINLTSLKGSCAYELLEILNDRTTSVSFTNQLLLYGNF